MVARNLCIEEIATPSIMPPLGKGFSHDPTELASNQDPHCCRIFLLPLSRQCLFRVHKPHSREEKQKEYAQRVHISVEEPEYRQFIHGNKSLHKTKHLKENLYLMSFRQPVLAPPRPVNPLEWNENPASTRARQFPEKTCQGIRQRQRFHRQREKRKCLQAHP